jgi:hypothetical protein
LNGKTAAPITTDLTGSLRKCQVPGLSIIVTISGDILPFCFVLFQYSTLHYLNPQENRESIDISEKKSYPDDSSQISALSNI